MIRKKSEKQKAIENSKVPMAVQTALEDFFAEQFQMGFDFKTDIQGTDLTITDVFIKFVTQQFQSEQHIPARVYWLDCSLNPDFDNWASSQKYKRYFETEILKTGEFNDYEYLAVTFNGVQSTKYTGKPCDIYFVELRHLGRFINAWVVKDYPQDHDPYHRYAKKS